MQSKDTQRDCAILFIKTFAVFHAKNSFKIGPMVPAHFGPMVQAHFGLMVPAHFGPMLLLVGVQGVHIQGFFMVCFPIVKRGKLYDFMLLGHFREKCFVFPVTKI